MAPLVSLLKEKGTIEAVAIPQRETFERGVEFTRAEGILPAPEANHAIAATVREALKAKAEGKETVIVFNNCGHGFLDLAAYENYLAGKLEDLDLEQGKIDAALGDLPKA
jgi:tryptophan synthase beta chain